MFFDTLNPSSHGGSRYRVSNDSPHRCHFITIMSSTNNSKHAIVFGSSGVSGWALVNELLHDYPMKDSWSRITALTNRPLKHETTLWPADKRLNLVSGVDLLEGTQAELDETMKRKITDVHTVTHVYYYGRRSQDTESVRRMVTHWFTPDTTQLTKRAKTSSENFEMLSIC